MVLSGKNNILHPGVREGIIVGDGNVIGEGENITIIGSSGNIIGNGCENIVLVNSFDCEVISGLKNVNLNNSSGVIVTSGDISYEGTSYKFISELNLSSQSGTATIYNKQIEVSAAEILGGSTTLKILVTGISGYWIDIISAQARVNMEGGLTNHGYASDIIINNGISVINYGAILNATDTDNKWTKGAHTTGTLDDFGTVGESAYLISNGPIITGANTATLSIFITYQFIKA